MNKAIHAKKQMKKVNQKKYLGKWHEQGSVPSWFQKGCKNTTAEYSMRDDGKIRVLNTCDRKGKRNGAEGRAIHTENSNRLEVTFFPGIDLFKADYNIEYVEGGEGDKPYQYAIVTAGKYVWILSRDKKISEKEYQRLIKKAKELGIDVHEMRRDRDLKELDKWNTEILKGGEGEGKKASDFNKTQVDMGIMVELEHTNDPEIALEIAIDHLTEDPEYYTKLATIHED